MRFVISQNLKIPRIIIMNKQLKYSIFIHLSLYLPKKNYYKSLYRKN
jgi:SAM-dependent MidA family methyltransferase